MRFGVLLPHGMYSEFTGVAPAEAWSRALHFTRRVEELGFDSVWVSDHLHPVFGPVTSDLFEAWTVLAAVSQRTERVRLGQLVLCNGFRPPALLAKMAATLDVLSGGRLVLGLGAGWGEDEFRAYGYDFGPPRQRLGELGEALELIRLLWSEPVTDFEGRRYRAAGAVCEPKPLQSPVPLLVGGVGRDITLRLVARAATMANFHGSPRTFADLSARLDEHCATIGRDPAEIERTLLLTQTVVAETDDEAAATVAQLPLYRDRERVRPRLVGTPEALVERLARYQDAGCTMAIINPVDAPATDMLERFADRVAKPLAT